MFNKERDVVNALLEAGADPCEGTPFAIDAARMFRTEDWFV
ncbi:hypothetical protein [Nonomuraea sediminis]|nr:hypothetical protein [Nonomuraea sediminis]